MNAAQRVQAEAAAVNLVRDQLAALGQTEPEYLKISIESETGFKELFEELLEQEAEADSFIAAIKARKDDLSARQERYAKRKETLRLLMASALEGAGLPKQETALGTVSISRVAPKVIVTDEAELPSRFWRPADPILDRKALTEALRARAAARAAAAAITDEDERRAALEAADAAHPEVPGASLSNGGASLTIRRK
ncbi:siphovirus Gp157 family protein [uncultured Enterovirga sp.]|uniref:siphovirus Gp157 family protein n=1 Tax=uncultured Enterovirga sp. TaxID=2026352 RepID=UPI0035CC517F